MRDWKHTLETYGFHLNENESKTKYMKCKFSKRKIISDLDMKGIDHHIS